VAPWAGKADLEIDLGAAGEVEEHETLAADSTGE